MSELSPAQREALGALLNAAPFAGVVRDLGRRFAERGLASPRLDAELLLSHVLGRTRVALYTHHDQPLGKVSRIFEIVPK
jgi:hypothetical protein